MKILIEKEINNCSDCPYGSTLPVYTPDSFDSCKSIFCDILNKSVHPYLYTFDKVIVPDECPFKQK